MILHVFALQIRNSAVAAWVRLSLVTEKCFHSILCLSLVSSLPKVVVLSVVAKRKLLYGNTKALLLLRQNYAFVCVVLFIKILEHNHS